MQTKTEQRHEHLTEEEKKISSQIRPVAATLYEKNDLDKLTVEFLCEHFFKDPILALAYFYCCSTDPCVAVFNNKLQLDVDKQVIWDNSGEGNRSPPFSLSRNDIKGCLFPLPLLQRQQRELASFPPQWQWGGNIPPPFSLSCNSVGGCPLLYPPCSGRDGGCRHPPHDGSGEE